MLRLLDLLLVVKTFNVIRLQMKYQSRNSKSQEKLTGGSIILYKCHFTLHISQITSYVTSVHVYNNAIVCYGPNQVLCLVLHQYMCIVKYYYKAIVCNITGQTKFVLRLMAII